MKYTAKVLAAYLKGEIVGNPEVEVTDISKIENGTAGTLTFLANPMYEKFIYTTQASVVIINKSFIPESTILATLIKVDDAYKAFASLLELYQNSQKKPTGIHPSAIIDPSATLGKDIYIGPNVFIGAQAKIGDFAYIFPGTFIGNNVQIGERTLLHPNVTVYHQCVIGSHCTIHAGNVIGADGFGFAPNSDNNYQKVPQVGNVIIEDHVEIGSNCSIDRATIGSTLIKKGAKLDNLIHIAHNVEIGENTVIAAQCGIAGSAKLGSEIMIGGQAGIIGHISIANGVKIAGQSGVGRTIDEPGVILQGSPAFEIKPYNRSYVVFKRLPELLNRLEYLEKELKELKSK